MGAELRVIDAEPASVNIVERLEELLDLARTGAISSVAFACVYRNGTSGRGWSDAPSLSALIGSIARLQYALLKEAEE